MLRESFVLLPCIKKKRERNLWEQGIMSWNDFLSRPRIKGISKRTKEKHDKKLKEARQEAWKDNNEYFAKEIPRQEHWRLWEEFRHSICYLDIETHSEYGGVTVVGMYDGEKTMTMIKGINLDRKKFIDTISKYKMLVTFNGSSFDIPILKRYFNWKPTQPHIDLMHVCRKVGLTGGLKAIEKKVGIKRRHEVSEVVGNDAPVLWDWWHSTGDKYYLELLVMYNEEDIINLEPLAKKTIPELWIKTRRAHQS